MMWKYIKSLSGKEAEPAAVAESIPTQVVHQITESQSFQIPLTVPDDTAKLLDEMLSETTLRERRFLYRFFSTIWSGEKDVIEIGPFLGGTTRAIAMGMCQNPRVSAESKLYTFDRFCGYYKPQRLTEYLRPMVDSGVLQESDLMNLGETAEFIDIFNKIHTGHDYSDRICPIDLGVPDKPDDLLNGKDFFKVPDGSVTDAVFVDGCKSWYGTKYFMAEVCKASRIGTYFIFQDYGWYTCFWISTCMELLKDHFQLIGYVDATYAFMLTKPLDKELIQSRVPDCPNDLHEEAFNGIYRSLIEAAFSRYDYLAAVRHTLHHAGAIAYLGHKEKAKEIIKSLEGKPWTTGQEDIISAAMRSPTYSPDGMIRL